MSEFKKALIAALVYVVFSFLYVVFLFLNAIFTVSFVAWGLQVVKSHSSNDKLFIIWGASLVGMLMWFLLVLPLGEKLAKDRDNLDLLATESKENVGN